MINRWPHRKGTTLALAAAIALPWLALGLGACGAEPPLDIVSTTKELANAIAHAQPGATIRLRPGSYVGVALVHLRFNRPITITSADPSHPATIAGLKIVDSSGFNFSQMEMSTEGSTDPIYGFRVQDSDNVIFDDMIAYGNNNNTPTMNRAGFYITQCSNITISNSKFLHMGVAITANKNDNIQVTRNLFSEMSKGGVEMGAVGFATITDNVFTNFQTGRGIHPDGVQIYTAGMPTSSHDISVVGNLVLRGKGNAIQGLFIQDEGVASAFNNLTVSDNAVIGGMWDSIYIRHVTGTLVVKDNIAASWPGLDLEGSGNASAEKTKASTTGFVAYIWLRGDNSGAALAMSGNLAQVYMGNAGRMSPPPGNKVIGDVTDEGKGLLRTWMVGHKQLLPLLAAANLP
jgi:hypothetical protein